jgi:hypothetical protein
MAQFRQAKNGVMPDVLLDAMCYLKEDRDQK